MEASNGFRGEPDTILLPSDPSIVSESELLRFTHDQYRMKQRVRARHETVNGRFKNWNILNNRFRNQISFHSNVFSAIVVITKLEIENGFELFSVKYDADEAKKNTITRRTTRSQASRCQTRSQTRRR